MKMFNLSVTNNAGWWQKKDEKFEEAGRGGGSVSRYSVSRRSAKVKRKNDWRGGGKKGEEEGRQRKKMKGGAVYIKIRREGLEMVQTHFFFSDMAVNSSH